MKHILFLCLLFPFFGLSQNYYDTNNPVEKLLSEKKFEEGLEYASTSLNNQKFEREDERNYYEFLKNMCEAQISVWRKGDLNSALASCAEAYKIIMNVKNVSPVRKSNFIQYYASLIANTGNNQKQVSLLEECFEILKSGESTKEVELELADNHYKIGVAFYNMYQDEKTLENYNEAFKIYSKYQYDDSKKMGELNHSMSLLNKNLGYFDKSEFHNDKAILIMEKESSSDVYEALFRAYELKIGNEIEYGRIQTAGVYLNKMDELKNKILSVNTRENSFDLQAIETRYLAASVNYNIEIKNKANILNSLSRLKKIYDFDKLNGYKKDNVYTLSTSFANAGIFFREVKDFEAAIKVNNEMLKNLQKSELLESKIIFNGNLAFVYNDLKQYDKALKYVNEAIQDSRKTSYPKLNLYISLQNEILVNKDLQHNTNDSINQTAYENTKVLVEKMLNRNLTTNQFQKINYSDFNNLNSERDLLVLLSSAEIHLKLFWAKKYRTDLELANKLYHVASDMFGMYYKKGIFNDKLSKIVEEINEGLLATTQELKISDLTEVLNKIESNYSKYLWNEFIIKNLDVNFSNAKNQIAILRQINTQKNNLISELQLNMNQQKTVDSLTQKIEKLEKEEKQLSEKIQQSNPIFETYSNPNLDSKSLQKSISGSQKILRYIFTQKEIFLFEITQKAIQLYSLGDSKTIEKKCKSLLTIWQKNTQNYINLSADVSKMLLPNNIQITKNTVIIADSFLNYLPFETLKGKSTDFLLKETNISYSASLLLWRDQNSNKKTTSNDLKLIAFAPKYEKNNSNESDIAYLQRNNLFELKGAKEEATQIADKFKGQLLSENAATKSSFLQNAKKFQLIHLAMHSVLDEENPQNSNLIFANNEKLFFSELYGISLPAKMAVISACNSGNGKIMNGEGIMSLSRAFTFAGVKSTVMSLWQVPDKETSEIMIAFYENLKDGQPKDEALANAKRDFIENNPMKNHPFYWAGFVVNGDVSPILESTNWWLYIGIGLAIGLLIFLFRKKLF